LATLKSPPIWMNRRVIDASAIGEPLAPPVLRAPQSA
jgi:hypothetical protein